MINGHEKHTQYTEWRALSQTDYHSAALIENGSDIHFYLFSILIDKTEQNKKDNGWM